MKDRGFLSAGYTYITLGGIGYANNSQPGGNITRNSTVRPLGAYEHADFKRRTLVSISGVTLI